MWLWQGVARGFHFTFYQEIFSSRIAERPVNTVRGTSPTEPLSVVACCDRGWADMWLLLGPDLMLSPSLVSDAGGGHWDSFLQHSGFFPYFQFIFSSFSVDDSTLPCSNKRAIRKRALGGHVCPSPAPSWPPTLFQSPKPLQPPSPSNSLAAAPPPPSLWLVFWPPSHHQPPTPSQPSILFGPSLPF